MQYLTQCSVRRKMDDGDLCETLWLDKTEDLKTGLEIEVLGHKALDGSWTVVDLGPRVPDYEILEPHISGWKVKAIA